MRTKTKAWILMICGFIGVVIPIVAGLPLIVIGFGMLEENKRDENLHM